MRNKAFAKKLSMWAIIYYRSFHLEIMHPEISILTLGCSQKSFRKGILNELKDTSRKHRGSFKLSTKKNVAGDSLRPIISDLVEISARQICHKLSTSFDGNQSGEIYE